MPVQSGRGEPGFGAHRALRVETRPGADGEPGPGADVAGLRQVLGQMWVGMCPVPAKMCTNKPSPGEDVAGVSRDPVLIWQV